MEQYLKIPDDQQGLKDMKTVYDWFYDLEAEFGTGDLSDMKYREIFAVMLTLGYQEMKRRAGQTVKKPDYDYGTDPKNREMQN